MQPCKTWPVWEERDARKTAEGAGDESEGGGVATARATATLRLAEAQVGQSLW